MLAADEVEALVGHAVGGVCPFGLNVDYSVKTESEKLYFYTKIVSSIKY